MDNVNKIEVREPEKSPEQKMNESIQKAVGNLGTAYDFTSWTPDGADQHGYGVVIATGEKVSDMFELEIVKNSNANPAFAPGVKVYVDDDIVLDGKTLTPLKDNTGTELGVSVKVQPGRAASVEEAMIKMKVDILAEVDSN